MISLAVAPAIIKVEMLMPVKAVVPVFDIAYLRKLRNDPAIRAMVPMNQMARLQIMQDFYNEERSFIIERFKIQEGYNYLKGEVFL